MTSESKGRFSEATVQWIIIALASSGFVLVAEAAVSMDSPPAWYQYGAMVIGLSLVSGAGAELVSQRRYSRPLRVVQIATLALALLLIVRQGG